MVSSRQRWSVRRICVESWPVRTWCTRSPASGRARWSARRAEPALRARGLGCRPRRSDRRHVLGLCCEISELTRCHRQPRCNHRDGCIIQSNRARYAYAPPLPDRRGQEVHHPQGLEHRFRRPATAPPGAPLVWPFPPSQATTAIVSLSRIARSTRAASYFQPRPDSMKSRDIAEIACASGGSAGRMVMARGVMKDIVHEKMSVVSGENTP